MTFSLWLESTNTELGFLRNVISNVRDKVPMMVFADWLEENSRPEANWIREVANGKHKKASRYIYNKYINGVTRGMTRQQTLKQFVGSHSDTHANPNAELIDSLAKEWDKILTSRNVSLYGSKVEKFFNRVIHYYPLYDAWVFHELQGDPKTSSCWLCPAKLPESIITPELYWIALCAILQLESIMG